jgi:DNA modification methylase
MTAKEWMKSQLGVWQFFYEGRDIRDKTIHPATFPISLTKKVIELFTHQGELVLDPFVGRNWGQPLKYKLAIYLHSILLPI